MSHDNIDPSDAMGDSDDSDDILAGIDLHVWRVPPASASHRPAILVRALAPSAAPRKRRIAWLVASLVILNAAIAALLAIIIARPTASAPAPVIALPAGPANTSNDPTVRELINRLDAERRELQSRLDEIDELRALADELAAKLAKLEERDAKTVSKRHDHLAPVPPVPLPVQPVQPLTPAPITPLTPSPSDTCDEVSCVLNNNAGACCAKFRRPAAAGLPDTLDRQDISDAMSDARPRIDACASVSSTKGLVKAHVAVDHDGRVTSVVIVSAPDARLGACVARVLQTTRYPPTKGGGSFTYPFVF